MNSDNNIFDDDFMRSNQDDDKVTPEALQKLSKDFENAAMSLEGSKGSSKHSRNNNDNKDEVDHQKFFKKMQECLSTNLNKRGGIGSNSQDMIETHEREMK